MFENKFLAGIYLFKFKTWKVKLNFLQLHSIQQNKMGIGNLINQNNSTLFEFVIVKFFNCFSKTKKVFLEYFLLNIVPTFVLKLEICI